ncbi:rho guanine nucleotide exchange factor 5-like isoform X2 [Sceloporus undulatus]|uniref:rho guanine nucleotide exchange factor 5-like isoform X2 n=1 Tax=Sceloporus undulatus TaxID=8520 RepID=UPI001C4A8931|nr:rho guanine nucleotide exchange factor 5-like isoform X2 [Sceloporus undulatus]
MATSQGMLRLDTVYNLKNKFSLPDLNRSNSLTEAEGFAFSFNVFSAGHCSESCVQNKVLATKPAVNASSSTQDQICNEFGESESSSLYDQTVYEQSTEGNRNLSLKKEASENLGDERSICNIECEGMAISCRDLFVMPNSQDLHNFKRRDCTVDVELRISTSPWEITTVAGPLPKGAGKEASDATVDNVVVCEISNSIEEPASKKQVGLMVCEDVSTVDSDTIVQATSKNGTCNNKDFHKYTQGSASKICESLSLEESLSNTTKENVESTLVTSLTMWDPLSNQEEDSTITYLEEFHQHIETPVKTSEFLGKEEAADTFCIKEEVSVNKSPYLSVLEEDKTEVDHNTDIPAFPTTDFRIGIDVTQLKESLAPVPVSNQCQLNGPATSHFSQLLSSLPSCSQPIQLLSPPDNTNALSQSNVHALHASCFSHFLEELPPCSQSCPFLAVESTAIKEENPRSATDVFDQSPNFQCELNQYSQPPDSGPSFEQYDNNQPTCMSIVLQKNTAHCAFPEHMDSQFIQQDNSTQDTECTAPGHNNNHFTEYPVFATNRGSSKPPPPFSLNKLPTAGGNQFAHQQAEVLDSDVPSNCTEGNGWIHTGVPIVRLISQPTHSVFQSENIAQIQYMNSIVEESSIVQLPKLEGGNAPQVQKDCNITEIGSDLGVNLLDTDLDMEILGDYTSGDSNAEAMPNVMDMHDAKSSFDCTSLSSLNSQKKCEATAFKNSRQPPPVLAFTNPIHFLQLGPPSPPTRHPSSSQADSQGPQWQQEQTGYAKIATSAVTRQLEEDTRRFRKGLETSLMEPICAMVQKTSRVAKHSPLEKSSSCPNKNVSALDPKESDPNSKKQEVLIKHRAKSKDWHRHGVRKISIPMDNELAISPVPLKEDAHVHKDKTDHLDHAKRGEKKPGTTTENIKRRHSKLINSSKVLYQEYSDVALNKAIQSQKRADSLTEDVELVSSSSPRLQRKVLPPQESYIQRLSVSSSSSLWQDIPKVRESTVLLSMSREEQKLQEAKFELIASEASYLRSLNIAVDHFQHSEELQAVLTTQDRQWLFSRLQDVRDVSANFLFDLEEKLEENMFSFNVCDVALSHASEFRRVYLPYVTNQTYQEQTFQRLLNGVPAFQQVLEKLESDPVCQRLSLKSFLILPFQRITRLKLLLQNILKRTQPGAEEEIQATQAYDALEKLIKDCNKNVQRMKSTEQLIYLSQNMEFECKIFPLISQSRRLVKCGELTALEYNLNLKWKLTTRSIYLHLFNDYLLLSRPKENGRFIVFDYAASSDVRGEKCEMKLHGANKNVFRLFLLQNNQGKKVEFLFRTETHSYFVYPRSEKLRWISAFMPQQTELDILGDSDAPQVQCVKSYKARENDELPLEKADIIMVLQQSTDGWIEGVKLSDGEKGWFPSDQVEFISSKQVRQMNLKEEQRVKNAKQQVFHRK